MQIVVHPFKNIVDLANNNLFSDEGMELASDNLRYWEEYIEPITNGGSYYEMMDELLEVLQETIDARWDSDSYGAQSVNTGSLKYADIFLKQWPSNLPMPEISVDPDGEISFDWIKNKNFTFSISFSDHGIINYAGIIGANKICGEEVYDDIPEIIFQQVKRIFSI